MNGPVAFAAMLTSYGNVHLQTPVETSQLSIPSDRPTLRYIRDMNFSFPRRGFLRERSDLVAGTVGEWFDHICKKGGERLSLIIGAESDPELRLTLSFLGSESTGIQVDYPTRRELWIPNWDTHANAQRTRIWSVSVKGSEISTSMAPEIGDLAFAKKGIRTALQDGIAFLRKAGGGDWFSGHFAEGLSALDSEMPVPPFYPDMLPSRGYSLLARQVIAGACYGWVFGGMGSWNDLWFSDDSLTPEYERVTEKLFQSIKLGLSEGVNSFSL